MSILLVLKVGISTASTSLDTGEARLRAQCKGSPRSPGPLGSANASGLSRLALLDLSQPLEPFSLSLDNPALPAVSVSPGWTPQPPVHRSRAGSLVAEAFQVGTVGNCTTQTPGGNPGQLQPTAGPRLPDLLTFQIFKLACETSHFSMLAMHPN